MKAIHFISIPIRALFRRTLEYVLEYYTDLGEAILDKDSKNTGLLYYSYLHKLAPACGKSCWQRMPDVKPVFHVSFCIMMCIGGKEKKKKYKWQSVWGKQERVRRKTPSGNKMDFFIMALSY